MEIDLFEATDTLTANRTFGLGLGRGHITQATTGGPIYFVDDEKDLVVPIRVRATNETPRFSVKPVKFPQVFPASNAGEQPMRLSPIPDLEQDAVISFTEANTFPLSAYGVLKQRDIPSGQTVDFAGGLLLADFFTPAVPDGDPGRLDRMVVQVANFTDSSVEILVEEGDTEPCPEDWSGVCLQLPPASELLI